MAIMVIVHEISSDGGHLTLETQGPSYFHPLWSYLPPRGSPRHSADLPASAVHPPPASSRPQEQLGSGLLVLTGRPVNRPAGRPAKTIVSAGKKWPKLNISRNMHHFA